MAQTERIGGEDGAAVAPGETEWDHVWFPYLLGTDRLPRRDAPRMYGSLVPSGTSMLVDDGNGVQGGQGQQLGRETGDVPDVRVL